MKKVSKIKNLSLPKIPVLLLLFAFGFISNASLAQIKIGINGGANFSTFTITGVTANITLTRKVGFSIGAIAEYPILNNLSIRLNAGYLQRGAQNTVENDNTLYFDYLELTPYVTYNVINSKVIAKIIVGLSFGHLINAKTNRFGIDINLKDDYKLSNVASNFGLEIEKKIWAKTSLIFNGVYSVGLKDISKIGGGEKTNDINLNAGFLYDL